MQPLIICILLGDSTPWHIAIPKSTYYTYCTNHSTTDLLPVIPDWEIVRKNKYLYHDLQGWITGQSLLAVRLQPEEVGQGHGSKYRIVELAKRSLLIDMLWWIEAVPSLIPDQTLHNEGAELECRLKNAINDLKCHMIHRVSTDVMSALLWAATVTLWLWFALTCAIISKS